MKTHIPLNLNKLPFAAIVARLVPGDHFTFIVSDPLTAEAPDDENTLIMLQEGDLFVRRFSDRDYPRVFLIRAVTHSDKEPVTFAYETIYQGFQEAQEAQEAAE